MTAPMKLTVDAITKAMGRIAPLHLAEAWDNVGLLLEAPFTKPEAKRVLLTIDLTESVMQEALNPNNIAAIICYHPPLFRPLRSLTMQTPLQKSMLLCISNGISIYSPHTALDSVRGGVNDWLASILGGSRTEILGEVKEDGAGIGRKVVFENDGIELDEFVKRVKAGLGLDFVQLARSATRNQELIKTVALCAGSGGSVIGGTEADLYFTGEMSHHEVLAAVAKGTHVLLCGHSNTERGYLKTLKDKLSAELASAGLPDVEVEVSKTDKDPLVVV